MSSFDYLRSTITKYRSGSIDDPYVDITESRRIINGQIQLSEIPVVSTKVRVLKYFEVPSTNLEELRSNEYRVDYTEGIVSFSSTEEGKDVTVSYKGRGNHYVSASRVWTKEHDGEVIETLKDVVEKSTIAIEQIEILDGLLDEAKVAIDDTNKATISANDSAITANTQASFAKQQGDYAKKQWENAQEKGLIAESQGIYAKEQGDNANEAARNANVATRNASDATSKANQAATDVKNAKDKAIEATTYANDAALNAETQGDYAKQHGDYAKQQGGYAKEQGTVVNDLIPILEDAVDSANSTTSDMRDILNEAAEVIENTNVQAVYAKEQGDYANKVGESLVHKGVYLPKISYEKRNIVYYKGSTYMCISDTIGNDPDNELYWTKITNMVWKGVFSSTLVYQFGDVVTDDKNEKIFMCVSDHVSEPNLSDSPNWVLLISVAEAISNVSIATNQAVTASANATQSASSANDAAGNATAQANYAKEQGNYAYKQASQIIILEENIKTTTQEAKIATQAANKSTQEMNELIVDAEDAVNFANEAVSRANESAAYAKEQGNYAKEQGIEANKQALSAESQAEHAKDQGDYAKQQGDYAYGVGSSLVNKGTYDDLITYRPLNIVVYNKRVYQNIKESLGILPTNTDHWILLLETFVSVTWDGISGKPNIEGHLINYKNPHQVTADQVGAYTKDVVDNKLGQKQNYLGFTPENVDNKGVPNGYVPLDNSNLIPKKFIPKVGSTYIVANESKRKQLTDLIAGDSAYETETKKMYFWDGAKWGNLNTDTFWDDIKNKPISTPNKLDESVSKMHSHSNKAVLDNTTESFTIDLKNKLNNIRNEATKVEKSKINGNIIINGNETNIYNHPTGGGNNHIPSGGKNGEYLKWSKEGLANWKQVTWNDISEKPINFETTEGAQQKADKALENAIEYADNKQHIYVGGTAPDNPPTNMVWFDIS